MEYEEEGQAFRTNNMDVKLEGQGLHQTITQQIAEDTVLSGINDKQVITSTKKNEEKNGEKKMDLEYEEEIPKVQRKEIREKIDQRPK